MPDDARDDPLVRSLAGLDEPRPLPAGLRDRLEATLLGGIDLPTDVRDDVEPALLLDGIDDARPLPDALRDRLESALSAPVATVVRPTQTRLHGVLGVAAAIVVLLGVLTLASTGGGTDVDGRRTRDIAGGPKSTVVPPGDPDSAFAVDPSVVTTAPPAVGESGAGAGATGGASQPSSAGGGAASARPASAPTRGAAPPFSDSVDPTSETPPPQEAAAFADSGGSTATTTPPDRPPLAVAVISGDPGTEAAFRGYIGLVNGQRGVNHRRIDLVTASPDRPRPAAVATVNLRLGAVASSSGVPSWVAPPLLEGLEADESVLKNEVFGFAGPPARQAHIAVDATFPESAPGKRATIFRAPGRDAEAAGFRAVLEARQVTVVEVATVDGTVTAFPSSDAAFLALDRAAAVRWLAGARAAGFSPDLGIHGVGLLFEPAVAKEATPPLTVWSPYVAPAGQELEAIRRAIGGDPGAAAIHGWVTAKALAYALWASDADEPHEVAAALGRLEGWTSGMAPRYEVRPGTRSRTPEAVLLRLSAGAVQRSGDFRRDRF